MTNAQKQPAISWGIQNLKLLEYREILICWRELQANYSQMTIYEAREIWTKNHRKGWEARLSHWHPHLVTGFLDVLPFSKLDLRLPALRHDIRYCKGGDRELKLDADLALRAEIERAYPHSLYARWVVARLVYWAVRTRLSHSHFSWGPRARGLPEYEAYMEGNHDARAKE